jgi:glycosyltransferase involved in cell wall biosynthesis
MRILELISSVNPAGGGPIEGLKQTAAVAARRGASVEVATLDDPAAPWVRDFPLPLHAFGPAHLKYSYAPRLKPWLRAHAHDYDAVVVHGLWQYHGFAARQSLRGSSTPYYVFPHGMLDPWFKRTYPLKHLKKWLYWPWADYRVLRDAQAVLFTTEEERLLARQSFWLYRCRETVVGYGTAAPTGDAAQQREAFYAAFPMLRDTRNLLFLSRLHPKKGCDSLLAAFARVARRDPRLRLVMAGPDQIGWQRTLVAQAESLGIAGRVTWTGMLTGDLKWGAYRAADAFVLPSHQENFGVVVAEALACGVPVLISDKVNIWREVQRAGAGLIADDTDVGTERLLESWLALAEPERLAMRTAAVPAFREHFEIEALVTRLHGLLQAAPDQVHGHRRVTVP